MLKLKEVKSPQLEVEMLDGSIRHYDPFEVVRRVSPILNAKNQDYPEMIEDLRRALEMPAELTDVQILAVVKGVATLVERGVSEKGLLPVPQS